MLPLLAAEEKEDEKDDDGCSGEVLDAAAEEEEEGEEGAEELTPRAASQSSRLHDVPIWHKKKRTKRFHRSSSSARNTGK